jgi:hypothetical protein
VSSPIERKARDGTALCNFLRHMLPAMAVGDSSTSDDDTKHRNRQLSGDARLHTRTVGTAFPNFRSIRVAERCRAMRNRGVQQRHMLPFRHPMRPLRERWSSKNIQAPVRTFQGYHICWVSLPPVFGKAVSWDTRLDPSAGCSAKQRDVRTSEVQREE